MSGEHHDTYLEWLYLEGDGGLTPGEASRLELHVRGCVECREERSAMAGLSRLLRESRVAPRKGFRREVMLSLPASGWESRSPRSWLAAAAVLVALLGSAVMVGLRAPAAGDPTVWGAVGAVTDLFRATLLAGGGLLTASWQSVGVAIERALGGSVWNLGVFALLVLGLDVLFLRLLIRASRRRAAAEGVSPRDGLRHDGRGGRGPGAG
jgi:predicted anti-sigma-YlaC factor YlaD